VSKNTVKRKHRLKGKFATKPNFAGLINETCFLIKNDMDRYYITKQSFLGGLAEIIAINLTQEEVDEIYDKMNKDEYSIYEIHKLD